MLRYIVLIAVMAALSVGDRQLGLNSVDFATHLYQKTVKGREDDNVVISPLAIRTALGLVYMGAEGTTADELVSGLHFTSRDKTTTADRFKRLLDMHSNIRDIKFANKIYAKQNCRIKNEFVEIAENKFKSEAENLDFGDTNNAVQTINNWVSSKTHNEIDKLVKQSDLDHDTEIVLANALHFDGSWKKTFDKHNTRERPFHTIRSGNVNTDMMSMSSKVLSKSSDELNADVIKLPYHTDGLYMLIMLPKEQDGLTNLEKNLNRINLLDLADSMVDKVDYDEITIPKFKIDYKLKLKDVLEKMDIKRIFSHDADLSKMVDQSQEIKISKVISKTQIDVTEEGPDHGTTQELRNVQGPQAKKFVANHPFFYVVMNEYGILVAGRYVVPHGH